MSKNDGGPAYPNQEMSAEVATSPMNPGMSLRDYFAGQALASMLSEPTRIGESTYGNASVLAYRFADAMIKVRDL